VKLNPSAPQLTAKHAERRGEFIELNTQSTQRVKRKLSVLFAPPLCSSAVKKMSEANEMLEVYNTTPDVQTPIS
jgi:triosephosphate isomerase